MAYCNKLQAVQTYVWDIAVPACVCHTIQSRRLLADVVLGFFAHHSNLLMPDVAMFFVAQQLCCYTGSSGSVRLLFRHHLCSSQLAAGVVSCVSAVTAERLA